MIERWIAKRYEGETARANLSGKGALFMACGTHEQAAGGRNNTRDEGGDAISAATHVSGGGGGGTPARDSLSSSTMEVVNVIHKMRADGLEAIMEMYAASPHSLEDVTVAPLEGSVDSSAGIASICLATEEQPLLRMMIGVPTLYGSPPMGPDHF